MDNTESEVNINENEDGSSSSFQTSTDSVTSSKVNNIDAQDLDEETIDKLKGDTVGDTLYSQSFIIKTLLKFSNLKWDGQSEEDLCLLWDMTVEKDVCKFLMEMSFPSLACSALINHGENNRFVEIVVGILGNIFCSDCENKISDEELSILLSVINSYDPLILIQLMRFTIALADKNKSLKRLIDGEFTAKICFILKNSINAGLLLKTLECVAKLTADYKKVHYINYHLYDSILVAYLTLHEHESDCFEPDTKEKLLSIRYLLESITNICSYIDTYKDKSFLLDIKNNSNIFLNEMIKILTYFSKEENLLPISDEIIFFISAINYIIINLKLGFIPDIFLHVTEILSLIQEYRDELEELFGSLLEMECYLISSTQYQVVKNILKSIPRNKVKIIINLVNENYKRYESNLNSVNMDNFIKNCL